MNRKLISIFLLLPMIFVSSLLASCESGGWLVTITPTTTPTITSTLTITATSAIQTITPTCVWPCASDSLTLTAASAPNALTPVCVWPCESDSLTMTAAMGATFAANPSNTPPAWATVIPSVGDLGWGSVYGRITDGVTNAPIAGATIRCEHSSYSSPYPCNGSTVTNEDGIYSFTGVFFHDTDRITLFVEAPGYANLEFTQSFFTTPEFHADLGLFPAPVDGTFTPTPTFIIMCTPPACTDGALTCGNPDGCPGGCGTICATLTPTP
jgi:hypothetical protein